MSYLSQTELEAFEATATRAAAYLDACDTGAKLNKLDPTYYQACGRLLMAIFSLDNPFEAFKDLIEESPAAREVAESLQIGHRIELSRLGYYPQLVVALNRAAI